MEFNGKKAAVVFTIKAVESIPCDLRGQILAFDKTGMLISDPLKTPWPMPWVTEEIAKLAADGNAAPQKSIRVYNPEEPDQYVSVSSERDTSEE